MKLEDRFMSHVDKTESCWLWTGHIGAGGYGRFRIGGATGKLFNPHRVSYELFVGEIPDGYTVDHQCHNSDVNCPGDNTCLHRRCVNPEHLEAVTLAENLSRAPKWYGNRTHCKRGHEFDEKRASNNNQRTCNRCHNMMARIRLGKDMPYATANC